MLLSFSLLVAVELFRHLFSFSVGFFKCLRQESELFSFFHDSLKLPLLDLFRWGVGVVDSTFVKKRKKTA